MVEKKLIGQSGENSHRMIGSGHWRCSGKRSHDIGAQHRRVHSQALPIVAPEKNVAIDSHQQDEGEEHAIPDLALLNLLRGRWQLASPT